MVTNGGVNENGLLWLDKIRVALYVWLAKNVQSVSENIVWVVGYGSNAFILQIYIIK